MMVQLAKIAQVYAGVMLSIFLAMLVVVNGKAKTVISIHTGL